MTNNSVIVQRLSARISSNALKEVVKRLRMKGSDDMAAHIEAVAEALDEADTIHIADQAGRA